MYYFIVYTDYFIVLLVPDRSGLFRILVPPQANYRSTGTEDVQEIHKEDENGGCFAGV